MSTIKTLKTGKWLQGWLQSWLQGWLALVLIGVFASSTASANALRCGNRIINEGQTSAEVLVACGQPVYRDEWTFTIEHTGEYFADTEVWYYDFGPQQLLRVVRLTEGVVRQIDTDGYGLGRKPALACNPNKLVTGLSKYRLLAWCGDPFTRRRENALRALRARPNGILRYEDQQMLRRNEYESSVYRETWVYNFGPQFFMRKVLLEDGWVVSVESLERGR